MDTEPKRKRGRPPGSRNKPKDELGNSMPRLVPPADGVSAFDDVRAVDPDTIVARQLTMLDWAQQAMRNEMKRAMQAKGQWISAEDIAKLEKLSTAIIRAIEALKRSSDLASEMASRMSTEQLLEAAIKKIEAQDLATLNYAIRRLRAHRDRVAPVTVQDKMALGELSTAVGAIASLDE